MILLANHNGHWYKCDTSSAKLLAKGDVDNIIHVEVYKGSNGIFSVEYIGGKPFAEVQRDKIIGNLRSIGQEELAVELFPASISVL